MLQRSIAISLGTTALVGAGGLIGSYLTGGFTDTYPMKKVVWKDKLTKVPAINSGGYFEDSKIRNTWAKRENEFLSKAAGKVNHPWWTELLTAQKGNNLNTSTLIVQWCINNNGTTVDVTSDKAEMLQKLCGVSFS